LAIGRLNFAKQDMLNALSLAVRSLIATVRVAASVLLVCSVAINFANIIGRYFFHSAISWAEEVMLFLMIGCVFLGAASVTWSGIHIRMDIFVRMLPEKARLAVELAGELVFLATVVALMAIGWPVIERLIDFDQRSMAANMPLSIPHAAIPLGLACMALLTIARLMTGRWREPPARGSGH
jgi:TRAP-type C4-dicarboxylate transport system permease small subunit